MALGKFHEDVKLLLIIYALAHLILLFWNDFPMLLLIGNYRRTILVMLIRPQCPMQSIVFKF